MLGLRESGDEKMIENMADNFAYLITRYGFIPNGNRTYYLSRSQPPCFALIVELIVERQGRSAYGRYLEPLEAEYHYWMDRSAPTAHVVKLRDGGVLNRYFDQLDTPRLEAFAEDDELAERSSQPRSVLLRHLRSAAESGWDFSSRWFADGQTIETIHTTDLVPVDLNCFLYQMELTLAKAFEAAGRSERQQDLAEAAARRKNTIQATCWSEAFEFYCDYDNVAGCVTDRLSLAGVLPLFFKIATPAQARAIKEKVENQFLRAGGLVTTLRTTGQQWDAPNGWAPLHWLTICGLEHYGYHELATEIAHRWIKLNRDVYARTGKLMEKYNVVDVNLEAGGGEYPSQDGFGWTNGVLMKLLSLYR
jgi:alpha,alpha-trehalase